MSARDTDRLRQALLDERERIDAAIEYLHQENRGSLEEETGELASSSVDNHLGDMATATFDREMDYTLEENSEHIREAIDRALHRLDDGTYGRCQSCGNDIGAERLEARPWAELCIDCKRRGERADRA